MNNFSIDMAAESEILNSNSILRLYKQKMMVKFMEIKLNDSELTQNEISKQLGYSDSNIKRYRDDINMDSPYIGYNYKKGTTKRKPPSIRENLSKNENSKSSSNKKTEFTILKRGNPTNIHMSGKELIEQVFFN